MTYKAYIKTDYKPVTSQVALDSASQYRSQRRWLIALFLIGACMVVWVQTKVPGLLSKSTGADPIEKEPALSDNLSPAPDHSQNTGNKEPARAKGTAPDTDFSPIFHAQHTVLPVRTVKPGSLVKVKSAEHTLALAEKSKPASALTEWQTTKVKRGESLSLIFKRMQLSPKELHEIMSLGKQTQILKRIKPGQELRFNIDNKRLTLLEFDIDLTNTLRVSRTDDSFEAETVTTELETRISEASGIINHSLFLAAQRAGLSNKLTMQLVNLYGWDIDFVLDIRKNDFFHVIYEEQYKDGVKVGDGPILAAEFVNRGEPIRAVRYLHENGRVDYYSEEGFSMRKAFLRTPVDFRRISSRFSLGRKHPILNTIRAHKGVDYAARSGTPIKATGDGVVAFAGRKGGYGRVVTLRHGGKYSTLYAHLSRYASGIRTGTRVKQGQTIGYVGMSGLATGPHLHYEFRINGVHRNPLTVKLPQAKRVQDNELPHFKAQTRTLLAQLDALSHKTKIAKTQNQDASLVAFNRDKETATSAKN